MTSKPSRPDELHFGPDDLARVVQDHPKASLVDQLFMLIAGRAHARRASAGTRLPSVRILADDCNVSRDTVARAYERLVAHGIVDARRGSGYFVKVGSRKAASPVTRPALSGPISEGLTRWRSLLVRPDAGLVSRTGSGAFPESWHDDAALSAAVRAVARQSMRPLTQYSEPQGYLPLRQQLQVKLQEVGILTEPENILVTGGAMEAMHLVCQAFVRGSRAPVIMEQPGPPLLVDRFLSTGMEIYNVPRLADGPDLGALRDVCEKHAPKFFFCSTVLQNPTCTQMAPHKAFQLLRLADEFDLTLVEDDSFGDLLPGATTVSRLATLDQLKRVIYVGGFSKTVAPGLRCGYLAASPERIDWLTTYRLIQSVSGSALTERILYKLLSGGSYRRHCELLRGRLAEVRPRILAEMQRWGLAVEHEMDAGMFAWASLGDGVDAMRLAERMLEQGHLLAPGIVFSRDPQHQGHLRINLAEADGSGLFPALGKVLGRRG